MATTPKKRRSLGLGQGQQVVHQPAVARLEDLQRQDDAGEEGRPEREQRDQLAHPASVRGASGRAPGALATLETFARSHPRRWPVLARIDLRGSALPGARELAGLLPRAGTDIDSVMATVRPLCEDVRIRGAQAVREITARLDGVDAEDFAVPQEALDRALAECDPALRAALEEAITRVRTVHADQRRTDVTTQVVPGGTVTERWVPVRRVGLYVPGGLAPLLSSVVMNVVPAQIAGVESIAVASPPQRDHGGLPDPGVLAACALLGVTEVYAVGGAQAVAVFGYGAGSCEPVDMVTGPGNVYVTAAKRLLRGRIGIDSEAGPTEVAILADDTADPAHVAADLISQAEHDPLAGAVLVTDSEALADAVLELVPGQVAATKHSDRISDRPRRHPVGHRPGRRHRRRAAGRRRLRRRAPGDPDPGRARGRGAGAQRRRDLRRRRGRRCRWATTAPAPTTCCPPAAAPGSPAGCRVQSFLRGIHVVEYDQQALAEVAGHIDALAGAEDLPAHAAAVRIRQR